MLTRPAAIGHSTNLIHRDDNMIIIRGGGEGATPVYMQMLNAVEEFFPESGILMEEGVGLNEDEQEQLSGYALRRVNTGVSSLVGHNNGERPGGFVLVIDGGALGFVRVLRLCLGVGVADTWYDRHCRTTSINTSCCGSRCSARA